MKRQRKAVFFLVCLIGISLSPNFSVGFWKSDEPLDENAKESIREGLLNKEMSIHPQINKLSVGFGVHNDIEYYFIKTNSKIFFQDKIIETKVTDINFKKSDISVDLYHPILGHGTLKFVFSEALLRNTKVSELQDILLKTLSKEDNQYVYCNTESKVYHLYTCNHLPKPENSIRMKIEKAEREGYRKCGFCFGKMLYLPELAVELAFERESSARLRYYEPILFGSDKQAHINNVGRRILKNWPFPLLGYHYQFHIVDSWRMNAFSIKNNAEDRGRKPVGESVPAEGWIVLSIKYYDMLPLWKYD